MRTRYQQFWDKFIVLHLFDAVSARSSVDGNTKAQKLTFLVELKAAREGFTAAHYRFFRYQLGPYSADLANDISELERLGFVTKTARALTQRGRFLHDYIDATLKERDRSPLVDATLQAVERVSADFGRKSGTALMNLVYGMKVPVFDLCREGTVREIPMFLDILDPVHTPGLTGPNKDTLPPDLMDDIEAELAIPAEHLDPEHPTFRQTIRAALDRASA